MQFAKPPPERDVLGGRNVLVTKKYHQVFQQRRMYLAKHFVRQSLAQIGPEYFRAECAC
jgi:CRISPR/Cas system-associated endonuclease Cas1